MWKKFLAVMAIVGTLAAQTAFAADPVPGGTPRANTPLVSIEASPTTFNPSLGVMTIKVTVSQDANVVVKVLDLKTGTMVAQPMPAQLVTTGSKTVTYNGLSQGKPIADGSYVVQAIASNLNRTVNDDDEEYFTVVSSSTPETPFTFVSFALSTATFNPTKGILTFNYSLSKTPSEASVTIKTEAGADVVTISDAAPTSKDGTLTWDGTINHGSTVVADGKYTATFVASSGGSEVHSQPAPFTITTATTPVLPGVINSTILKNVFASPNPWDPSDEELEIEWELSKDVKDFSLVAKRWNSTMTDYVESIELWEDEDMDQDDYEFDWNGLDEDDEMIKEGNWDLVFKADNDTVHYSPIVVQYSQVAINSDLFVTKTPFDNSIGEFTYVVFRVDQASKVTVEVTKKGGKRVETLMDEEEISKNKWTAVKWDGTDKDGDDVDEGSYQFKITAANVSNEDIKTYAYADVTVEEDEVSNKANATNDFITPVVVDKNSSEDSVNAVVQYTIDDDTEVTVEIFKGTKSSNPEIVLEKNVSKSKGTYVLYWNGRDEDGKKLDKNAKYSYRVTAKTEGSANKTDKERGFFVIGDSKTMTVEPPVVNPPVVEPPVVEPEDCGFWDVDESSEYCTAIAWVKDAGIFDGNPNGAFKPYNFINRAEALKVVLKAFDVPVLPDDYTNLGFADTITGSWYMKYLRTGKFYGMVSGYAGTKMVKPSEQINRVELLKYVLEAAETVGGYDVPVCTAKYYSDTQSGAWYSDYVCMAHDYNLYNTYAGYFYPGNKVMRGEVALLLYRLAQAGLLQ